MTELTLNEFCLQVVQVTIDMDVSRGHRLMSDGHTGEKLAKLYFYFLLYFNIVMS